MYSLHAGHPFHESVLIVALAVVVLASAFALTRDGWSRVGALVGAAAFAGSARLGIEAVGTHAHGAFHLLGHGLEIALVTTLMLAGYYALDAWSSAEPTTD